MARKLAKMLVAVLGLGALSQFGGCLIGNDFTRRVVIDGVTHEAWEFLLDNAAVFDLFIDN